MPIPRKIKLRNGTPAAVNLTHIAPRISTLRKELNLTQKYLGELFGVTGPSILHAERKTNSLTFEMMVYFAENFRVNPAWMMLEDNSNIEKYFDRPLKRNSFSKGKRDTLKVQNNLITQNIRAHINVVHNLLAELEMTIINPLPKI